MTTADGNANPPTGRPHGVSAGQALFVLGLGAAAGMDAVVKVSLGAADLTTLVVWRGLGAAVIVVLIVAAMGRMRRLRPASWPRVLARGAAVAAATALFFWSLGGLSLAAAYVITFTMPFTLSMLAGLFLREPVGRRTWLLILLGFAGVAIAVSPQSLDGSVWHALAAFAATVFYAASLLMARATRASESAEATAVWTLVVVGALAVAAALTTGGSLMPVGDQWLPLAAVAVLGALSQWAVILAFRAAPAGALASFEYTTLPWAVILDLVIWGVVPDVQLGAGCAVVIAAVWLASRQRRG